MRQIEQRITEALSSPGVRQGTLRVEVRPAGAGAAIIAAGVTIMTVSPDDAADTRVPTLEVANQWAARLAEGLRRALRGRAVVAQTHVPQTSPRPGQPGNGGSLTGVTWHWRGTLMGDDSGFMPADPRRYTLQFSPDGRVAVRADCNTGLGTYSLRGRALTVTVLGMTKAACESGSLDRRFLDGLRETSGYLVRNGDLILMLRYDSGTMRFSRAPGL
jgi:heat shock protein HslJ